MASHARHARGLARERRSCHAPSGGPMSDYVPDADKRAALEQVLRTLPFRRGRQVRRFLRYICEMEFAGRANALHEYLVGVEALGRPTTFSTDDDSTVRRRAYALRQKLDEVYAKELTNAAVRIEVPKGAYVPRFTHFQDPSTDSEQPLRADR